MIPKSARLQLWVQKSKMCMVPLVGSTDSKPHNILPAGAGIRPNKNN